MEIEVIEVIVPRVRRRAAPLSLVISHLFMVALSRGDRTTAVFCPCFVECSSGMLAYASKGKITNNSSPNTAGWLYGILRALLPKYREIAFPQVMLA